MKSESNSLRISPKKMNLVAGMVREKDATVALNTLKFTPKKAAKLLYKAVKSAVSNAENNFKQDLSSLYIKEIIVTKGMTLKRNVPISRGRVHPILKRGAHIEVILGVKEKTETPKKVETKPKTETAAAPKKSKTAAPKKAIKAKKVKA